METKIILLYGHDLPPYKHIEKIAIKYWNYYVRDKNKGIYDENQYYEIWISFQFTAPVPKRCTYITLSVPIRKQFLLKFLSIFEALKGNVCLCEFQHAHPITEISGTTYEGYCYFRSDGKSLFFLVTYCNEVGYEDNIFSLDWYQRIPREKCWHIANKEEDTNKVFDRWVKELISSYP